MHIAGMGTPYWYEWEVGLIECLKMMTDTSIESVILQCTEFMSLDDVVVRYKDNSIVNIQVKHTENGASLSYSDLISDGNMLNKWANEWKEKNKEYDIREIRIVTNRPWGTRGMDGKCSFDHFITYIFPKLKKDYNYISLNKDQETKDKENKAIDWWKGNLSNLGDEAADYVKKLSFHSELDLEGVGEKLQNLIKEIIGTDKKEAIELCLSNLRSMLEVWTTSRRTRQEIYREDIYKAICRNNRMLPEYELYPTKPIFPSRISYAKDFIDLITSNKEKFIFLEGLPGAGKTNFVSYLAQLTDSIVDFRYYTYLPVNRDYPSYSDDEGFYTGEILWLSILSQMKEKFERLGILSELEFPLVYGFLSVTEMRIYALKYLPLYAKEIGRTCYFFIDGIDHAARSNDSRNSFLHQLPQPNEIGDGVKFILVGQPINDKYPNWMISNNEISYHKIPSLMEEDVEMLIKCEKIEEENIDLNTFSKAIISVVGNNALNVLFAIQEVKKMASPNNFDNIILALKERHLNQQINRYYEWIINSIEESLLSTKIELIFAFSSRKISITDISLLCGTRIEEVVFIMNKFYPMIVCDDNGYYAFHNDIRLYFREISKNNSCLSVILNSIKKAICDNKDLSVYKYDVLIELLISSGDISKILEVYNTEYIVESVCYEISINMLIKQFDIIAKQIIANRKLKYFGKMSIIGMALAKYADCIQYNEKEIFFDEKSIPGVLTYSEKYVLDSMKCLNEIINDVYGLIKKNEFERSKKLFEEYLNGKSLNEYLNVEYKKDREFYEHCGFICRYYNPEVLLYEGDIDEESSSYPYLVNGWLEASVSFLSVNEIRRTFVFRKYHRQDILKFTKEICEGDVLDQGVCNLLVAIYLKMNLSIASMIELVSNMLLCGYKTNEGVSYIKEHIDDIYNDSTIEYNSYKIAFFIKYLFCVYPDYDEKKWNCEYKRVLEISRIDSTSRGYKPAIEQAELSKGIFALFNNFPQNQIDVQKQVYELVYFGNQYGAGSCHDCEAYTVLRFLRKVFVQFWVRKNTERTLHHKVCKTIESVMTGEEPKFISDFMPLFYFYEDKEAYINIIDYWFGPFGKKWNDEYSELEYCCNSIIPNLNKYEEFDLVELILKRKDYKLLGYVGHKDYSLMGLQECYISLKLDKKKLVDFGMELLEISDAANDIGDNRVSNSIEKELFDDAVKLGPAYIFTLFELKNNPSNFLYWRECVLSSIYGQLDIVSLDDRELYDLYRLTNAWINCRIESCKKYGRGRMETLKHYNKLVIEQISDSKMKAKLSEFGNCNPEPIIEPEYPILKDNYSEIYQLIDTNGYSESIETIIKATYTDKSSGQTRLLEKMRELIPNENMEEYICNCIIPYIAIKGKYGFHFTGIKELLECYAELFTEENWLSIFEIVVSRIVSNEVETIRDVGWNIETITLLYYKNKLSDQLEILFNEKCKSNKSLITACGLINDYSYSLEIDDTIVTLSDFVDRQIGRGLFL